MRTTDIMHTMAEINTSRTHDHQSGCTSARHDMDIVMAEEVLADDAIARECQEAMRG